MHTTRRFRQFRSFGTIMAIATLMLTGMTIGSPTTAHASGIEPWNRTSLTAGEGFTCAIRRSDQVMCWGQNNKGQLGNGTLTDSASPVLVAGLTGVTSVSAGWDFVCALLTDGEVTCWGANNRGQLGNGTTTPSSLPVVVSGLRDAKVVSSGDAHVCAVRGSGAPVCWGANDYGQLGIGNKVNATHYAQVSAPDPVVAIAAGSNHSCYVTIKQVMSCWGDDSAGQLGDGDSIPPLFADRLTPGAGPNLTGVLSVTAGSAFTCAQTKGGDYCFGDNFSGELGNGTTTASSSPTSGVYGVSLTAGLGSTACSTDLSAVGHMYCWGRNAEHQVSPSSDPYYSIPTYVPGADGAVAIAVGPGHTCAAIATGAIHCWGDNIAGQLGDGTTTSPNGFVTVKGISDAESMPLNRFTATKPTRLLDTRPTSRIGYSGPKPVAGQVIALQVRVPLLTPADTVTATLNITATEADGGFVTVWPCDQPMPNASSLNMTPGLTAANLVVSKLSPTGTVCLYTQMSTHLIADLEGFYTQGARYAALQPKRILDTRPTSLIGYSGTKPAAGAIITLDVPGSGGFSYNNSGVVLNITGTDAAGGFVTVWPCNQALPVASNLNLLPGTTRANLVMAKTSDTGTVCLYTSAATHLIADLVGFFPGGDEFTSIQPLRVLDTRPGSLTGYSGGKPAAGQTVHVNLSGLNLPLLNSQDVVLNLTADQATGGFVTVYRCGQPIPTASNLNLIAGDTRANLVVTHLDFLEVCIYTDQPTHLIVDLEGWFRPWFGG
jgi:alpha-tubulin suppressor-like RCC1 family protein